MNLDFFFGLIGLFIVYKLIKWCVKSEDYSESYDIYTVYVKSGTKPAFLNDEENERVIWR